MTLLMSGRVISFTKVAGRPNDRSNWYMDAALTRAINVHSPKLITHISQGPLLPGILRSRFSPRRVSVFRRGRRASSPPQFGQMPFVFRVQLGQSVHSYEQTYASPSGRSVPPHFSHRVFISKCMGGILDYCRETRMPLRHYR